MGKAEKECRAKVGSWSRDLSKGKKVTEEEHRCNIFSRAGGVSAALVFILTRKKCRCAGLRFSFAAD